MSTQVSQVLNSVIKKEVIFLRYILTWLFSVLARLGKGQGAKEIGHNLAREQRKIGHNLVRKRHKIGHSLEHEWPSEAHFYAWTIKIRSQSSTRTKRSLGTIL